MGPHHATARICLVIALAAATSTRSSAQAAGSPEAFRGAPPAFDTAAFPKAEFRNRLIPATIGGLAGAVTFATAGYWIAGGCTRKCDVLNWDEVIVGGLVGAIGGSTWGAAMPPGRGLCTPEQRIGMGLGGAFLGTVAALGLAQIPHSRPGVIVTIPLGAVMFMGGC